MRCTYNGQGAPVAPGGGGGGATGGNIGSMCEDDGDCTGGNGCCTITAAGNTVSICYPDQYCEQIQAAAANSGN